ncbi:fra a 1-associated protein-like [Primulina tabacum]|uniref:fra a 1-associated protein-like n=1 Tax=Primulina tabacum TaxID=48773 RepID=UPI003F5A4A93
MAFHEVSTISCLDSAIIIDSEFSANVEKVMSGPSEVVESIEEYVEEDVADKMAKGSFSLDSADPRPPSGSYFPGLRGDIEAIERSFFGGFGRFFEAAEEMKNGFFNSVGFPPIYDGDSSSSSCKKHGIHIERHPRTIAQPKKTSDEEIDLSGLANEV